ncbi:MAG: hypothetical protein EU544_06250, partial [Promethearchaeota archaeon]
MTEKEVKNKELQGFAKIIWKILIPLNQNPKFKRAFKDEEKAFLLKFTDAENAILIQINHGKIKIDSLKEVDNLYDKYDCDAMLQTDLSTFLEISSGELSTWDILKKIIKREIKVKGLTKLPLLSKIIDFNQNSLGINGKTILRDVIKNWAEIYGDKEFLTYIVDFDKGLDEKYSFKDMHILSNRLANGFLETGIEKGDGVALMNINSPEYLFTIFANLKIGSYT